MNYMPDLDAVRLKDSWVFVDREDIHLFFLAERPDNPIEGRLFGHAVSRDWLHWETLEPIDVTGTADAWDAVTPGTGYVFQYDDGKYYLAYTGRRGEGRHQQENISLMVSEDLRTWTKISASPIWPCPQADPYENHTNVPRAAWRDPFIVKNPEGQWEAFCSARRNTGPMSGRACVGRAKITDIDNWETISPIEQSARYAIMEVPEIFALGGKFWMLFSTGGPWWGQLLHTSGRENTFGTYYLVSDSWEGPYQKPENNLLIGAGQGHIDGYAGRMVRYKGEPVLYHHYHSRHRALGLPKIIACRGDHLFLKPWGGIDGLHTDQVQFRNWKEWPVDFIGLGTTGRWAFGENVITGKCSFGGSLAIAEGQVADIDLTMKVQLRTAVALGVIVGTREQRGVALIFDSELDQLKLTTSGGMGAYGPAIGTPIDTIDLPVVLEKWYSVRLIRRERFLEIYINDELQFSTATDDTDPGKDLGFFVKSGTGRFQIESAWGLEKLPTHDWPV